MYTILITDDNNLVTTVKQRIMQRSKLVDTLHFLTDQTYNELDMRKFSAVLEYMSPQTNTYRTESLILSDELYKDKLEYKLPVDTNITKECGDFEISIIFTCAEMSPDGFVLHRSRKTGPGKITVIPYAAWSDFIPDEALTAIDQRLIKAEALINSVNDMNLQLESTKADNIILNSSNNTIQLVANGKPIGNTVEWVDRSKMVTEVNIDDNGDLIVTMYNGNIINAGHVGLGNDNVVFTPHISDDYIMSWTNNGGLENPPPVDLNPLNNWHEITDEETKTMYVWNSL